MVRGLREWTACDLARVDALQICRSRTEIGVTELALDDVHRHAFARKLDPRARDASGGARTGGALPHRAPAAVVLRARRSLPSALRGSGRRSRRTAGRAATALGCARQASSCSNPNWSMPASRRLSPLPCRISSDPRRASTSVSFKASASEIRSPPRHSTAISARIHRP
jgi:hypothetical protein